MARERKRYAIMCFGDSLTAGYQSATAERPVVEETPYGAFLQARLGEAATVVVSGVCGELTSDMVPRFRAEVKDGSVDYAVILGGTNDLGWHVPPAVILANLKRLYEHAVACRVRPVAMTVPSLRVQGADDAEMPPWVRDLLAQREALNQLIQDHASQNRIACIDLYAETVEPGTGLLAPQYSNDGLHFTTAGYRLMAELLYQQVFRSLGAP